ncbi:hypothetical protein BJ741DRAFT_598973 [Chytriomyces cf. hyalinus JEL632]|nr:hypothetical protein BJ741DRAFT_598973 [Chytriomyces cf. hyalinus JEL632]
MDPYLESMRMGSTVSCRIALGGLGQSVSQRAVNAVHPETPNSPSGHSLSDEIAALSSLMDLMDSPSSPWLLDAVAYPLRALLTSIVDHTSSLSTDDIPHSTPASTSSTNISTESLLRLLDVLYRRVFRLEDEALNFDLVTEFALIARLLFDAPDLVRHFKQKEAWDILQIWGPLTLRFNIGMSLVQLAMHIGLDEQVDEWEMVLELESVYDADERRSVFQSMRAPVSTAIDETSPAQHRRRALIQCLETIKATKLSGSAAAGRDPAFIKAVDEINAFGAISSELVKSKEFSFMLDIFVDLVQEIHTFLSSPGLASLPDCSWIANTLIILTHKFKNHDRSALETVLGPIILVLMIQDSMKYTPDRDFDIFDSLFAVFSKLDVTSIQYVSSCFSISSAGARKAAVKHLGPLLRLAKAGNSHVGIMLVGLMSTEDKGAFRSCLDELFDISSPAILVSFIVAFCQEPALFLDRVPQLLCLLENDQVANTVSTIIIDVISRQPTVYSNAFVLNPIVAAFLSPKCKVENSNGTSMAGTAVSDSVVSIHNVLATSSDEGCYLCTPLLFETMELILASHARDASEADTKRAVNLLLVILETLNRIATWHPELVAPEEHILEIVVGDPLCAREGGRALLDAVERIVDSLQTMGDGYETVGEVPRRILTFKRMVTEPSGSFIADGAAASTQILNAPLQQHQQPTGGILSHLANQQAKQQQMDRQSMARNRPVQSGVRENEASITESDVINARNSLNHFSMQHFAAQNQTTPYQSFIGSQASSSNWNSRPVSVGFDSSHFSPTAYPLGSTLIKSDAVDEAARETMAWLQQRLETLELTVDQLKRDRLDNLSVIEAQTKRMARLEEFVQKQDELMMDQQRRILEFNASLRAFEHRQQREMEEAGKKKSGLFKRSSLANMANVPSSSSERSI